MLLSILRILLVAACIATGLFFTLETYLCLNVDGVHLIGCTLMPALALLFFTLAWLIIHRRRKRKKRAPDDERMPDPPEQD